MVLHWSYFTIIDLLTVLSILICWYLVAKGVI